MVQTLALSLTECLRLNETPVQSWVWVAMALNPLFCRFRGWVRQPRRGLSGLGAAWSCSSRPWASVASRGQVVLLVVRVGLTGALPSVAAAAGTRTGQAPLSKLTAWLLAALLYRTCGRSQP